jgi:hypothetical protein
MLEAACAGYNSGEDAADDDQTLEGEVDDSSSSNSSNETSQQGVADND